MEKFKTGDVVSLRSGGPKMTVKEYDSYIIQELATVISDTEVICEWFDGSDLKGAIFHEDALQKFIV